MDLYELAYEVERHIAEQDAVAVGSIPDTTPYIQEGDIEDVFSALDALGYKIVPKE